MTRRPTQAERVIHHSPRHWRRYPVAVALLAAILLLVAACGGSDTPAASDAPASTTEATVPASTEAADDGATSEASGGRATGEDVHIALVEGASAESEPVKNYALRMTIQKITDAAIPEDNINRSGPDEKFWVVDAVIENVGSMEAAVGFWTLQTTDGEDFDPTLRGGFGETLFLSSVTLKAGETAEGVIVFAIPEEASPKFLYYEPNPFLGEVGIYFNAE